MCSSFIYRRNGAGNIIIGMNFDNNGQMDIHVPKRASARFQMKASGEGWCKTCAAVTDEGTFAAVQLCDNNKLAPWRTPRKGLTNAGALARDVADKRLRPADLTDYLSRVTVTNNPKGSVHDIIADATGRVWLAEPGRGFYESPPEESPFVVMTNFSLMDYWSTGKRREMGASRYDTASQMLENEADLDVAGAFAILKAIHQNSKGWHTDFSMVYSQREHAVYYCLYADFDNITRYAFSKPRVLLPQEKMATG